MEPTYGPISIGKYQAILISVIVVIVAMGIIVYVSVVNIPGNKAGIVEKKFGGAKLTSGRILAVGQGPRTGMSYPLAAGNTEKNEGVGACRDGKRVPIDDLKRGDRVLYERPSSLKLPSEDGDVIIARYEAIEAILDDDAQVDVITTEKPDANA